MKKAILIWIVALAVAGCGDLGSRALSAGAQTDAAARQRCASEQANVAGYGRVDALAGAFDVSIGEFARWSETRHGPDGPRGSTSRWTNRVPTERVVVCYFDGSFSGFPRPRSEVEPQPYDRIIIVAQGASGHVLDAAGYRATLPVTRPTTP